MYVFYKKLINGNDNIPNEVYFNKFAHNAFELGSYDKDLVSAFDVTVVDDIDKLRAGHVITINAADQNYTITKPQHISDLEDSDLEMEKIGLYTNLSGLKDAQAEMVADSRDTTKIDAMISGVETKITAIYA